MKKKFYLIGVLALALALSGRVYAYTNTASSAPLGATAVEGDIVTVKPAATQPHWEIVLEKLQLKLKLEKLQIKLNKPQLKDSQRQRLEEQIEELQQLLHEAEIPTGKVFKVYVNKYYTGDLLVKVYLVNAGALSLAYDQLDIELTLANSVDGVQTLTMDKAVATFNLVSRPGNNNHLRLVGGSYHLISDNPEEWAEGWTITPEFYCEATQR
jgi:hypothetical protein